MTSCSWNEITPGASCGLYFPSKICWILTRCRPDIGYAAWLRWSFRCVENIAYWHDNPCIEHHSCLACTICTQNDPVFTDLDYIASSWNWAEKQVHKSLLYLQPWGKYTYTLFWLSCHSVNKCALYNFVQSHCTTIATALLHSVFAKYHINAMKESRHCYCSPPPAAWNPCLWSREFECAFMQCASAESLCCFTSGGCVVRITYTVFGWSVLVSPRTLHVQVS